MGGDWAIDWILVSRTFHSSTHQTTCGEREREKSYIRTYANREAIFKYIFFPFRPLLHQKKKLGGVSVQKKNRSFSNLIIYFKAISFSAIFFSCTAAHMHKGQYAFLIEIVQKIYSFFFCCQQGVKILRFSSCMSGFRI